MRLASLNATIRVDRALKRPVVSTPGSRHLQPSQSSRDSEFVKVKASCCLESKLIMHAFLHDQLGPKNEPAAREGCPVLK